MDQLAKFDREVSKKSKDDYLMLMTPFSDMESQLSAAPLCLAILGQVNLIATGKDFSLLSDENHSYESLKFKYLTEPRSFRSSLDQVNNQAFKAFRVAHKNMGAIQLKTRQIPGYMQATVQLLLGDSPDAVKSHVPIHLKKIQMIAKDCTEMVEEVEKHYETVIDTLGELSGASLYKQGKTEEAKEFASKMKTVLEEEKKQREKMKERCEGEYENIQKKLEYEEKNFNAALQKANSGWETLTQVGLAFVDTTLHTVIPTMATTGGVSLMAKSMSNTESGIAAGFMGLKELGKVGLQSYETYQAGSQKEEFENSTIGISSEDQELLGIADTMKGNMESILGLFKGDTKIDWKKMKTDRNVQTLQQYMERQKETVNNCKDNGANPKIINKVEKFMMDTEDFLKDLHKQAESEPDNVIDLYDKLNNEETGLIKQGTKLVDATKAALNIPIMKKSTPGMIKGFKDKIASGNGSQPSLTEASLKMAHTKLEMMREQSMQTQKMSDIARDRQLESNKKLQETLIKLSNFKAQEATQTAVLDMLFDGIKQFAALKTQWSKLLMFFTSMSNLVKVSLASPLDDFIKHSQAMQIDKETGAQISKIAIDQIYTPSYEAVKIAYLVNNLANVYVEISTDYLVPQVAKLTELLALSSTRDEDQISIKKLELNTAAEAMQEKIEEIVIERSKKFEENVNERMEEIDKTFDSLFPQITVEQKKKIKDEVKKDIEEAKEDFSITADEFC